MRIEKKVWPQFFEKLLTGEKTFEVRLADFECKIGDELVLKEYDPDRKAYTGRELTKAVTYVAKTKDFSFWPAEEVEKYGLQIIGFK
jgi:hypothetical protein